MVRKHSAGLWGWVALVALLAGAVPAAAQGIVIGRPVPGPRPAPAPVPRPLTIRAQKIALTVDSGAVRTQVSQVFHNPSSTPMEGTYLFNLPEGAAVANFRMQVDREPVDGRMVTVEEARRIYEQFVRQQVDPGILEYVGRNAFRARVFPIPGQSDKEIQIGYSHPAGFQDGLYQVTYPLNTEKVSPEPLRELSIRCEIRSRQPIKAIYSPTHEIQVRRESDHAALVTFEAKESRANRDFVVYYSVSEKEFGLNLLSHRKPGEDGYVMMMLAPRRDAPAAQVLPKDVVFVFDTSGSMQGAKIEQAKRALQSVLAALSEKDRFNIIRFSTEVGRFRDGLVPASPASLAAAREFVGGFQATGGTAIDDALQAGLASLPPADPKEERARFLIFMTDGLPTIGQTNVQKILESAEKARKKDMRFFAFGVGHDVNTLLLDRLALDGSGAADYIGPDEDLETKINGFYAKIANPVLANVRVQVDGVEVVETYPKRLSDLFAGAQLLVLGRYKGTGKATVRVTGEIAGAPRTYTYQAALPAEEKEYSFLPKLWAGRKIGYLLEEIRLHGENAELKDEVVRLSKEHGIITPYTAFLVEEPGAVPPGTPRLLSREPNRFTTAGRPDAGGAIPGRGRAPAGGFGGRGGIPGPPAAGAISPAPAGEVQRQLSERRAAANQEAFFRQTTGRDAIAQSKRLQQLKEQLVQESEVESLREVDGRQFRWQDGIWNDATADEKLKVVTVKFGSDAYFQLLRANPEWGRFLALGKNVVFRAGRTHRVRVSEMEGKEKLTEAELKALVE